MKRSYPLLRARTAKTAPARNTGILGAMRHACILLASLGCGLALANPDNPTVVAGSATFGGSGNELLVTNTPGTIINWQGFSISGGEITRFMQQSVDSAVLNRVVGMDNSSLQGQLLSNGRVFLVNPNGIIIGGGARIDTAGFIASTLDIKDDDFLAGNYHFNGGGGGVIINNGTITSGPGGEVVLIAATVENGGVINALDGEIILAAGREVTLTSLDSENISYRVSAPGDRALNLGDLIAQNGAVGVFASQVTNRGNISANRVTQDAAGRIVLQADGLTEVSGNIDAQGQNVPGGDITILGNDIRLSAASVDASGTNGGRVRIGGAFQGGGELPAASRVEIDTASVVHADALQNGSGGRVIVWSEQSTRSYGRLTARGGSLSGDGGLVETSSRGNLDFGQPADVSASSGAPGTWLLDPEDVVIDSGQAASISSALDGGSNVEIRTADSGTGEGNITVAAPIRKTTGPDAALGLIAHNRIDVNAPIESVEGRLSVSLRAGRDIAVNAPITTNGGGYSAVIDAGLLPAETPAAAVESGEDAPDQAGDEGGEVDAVDAVDAMEDPTVGQNESVTDATGDDGGETAAADAPEVDNPVAMLESGVAQHADVNTGGGEVSLDAGAGGLLDVSATIDATNQATGGNGGNIRLLGEQVGLFDDALVDASGHGGGGEILVGGGQQGLDPAIDNASAVYLAPTATVRADALVEGDGGTVIIYADDTANVLGEVSARGGAAGGDGGLVETSGRTSLRVSRAPDVSADSGEGGTWLIDPDEINIVADISTTPPPLVSPFTSMGDATIEVQQIGQALAGGDVVITTGTMNELGSGNINWMAELVLGDYGTFSTPIGSLALNAENDIVFTDTIDSGFSFSPASQRLQNLTLNAGGDVIFDGAANDINISTNADITITAENLRLLAGAGGGAGLNAGDQLNLTITDTLEMRGDASSFTRALMNADGDDSAQAANIQTANLIMDDFSSINIREGSILAVTDTLTLDGGQLTNYGQTEANNMVIHGGRIQGFATDDSDALTTTGTVTIDLTSGLQLRQPWNIAATSTVNWLEGDIVLRDDINNAGTFNAIGDDFITIADDGEGAIIPPGVFNNLTGGVFNRVGVAGESATFRGVDFINQGTVDIRSGDLRFVEYEYLRNGVTQTDGTFVQSAGETVLNGGTLTGKAGALFFDPDLFDLIFDITDTNSVLQFTGGALNGGLSDTITTGGSINADLDLQGVEINPGHSPGTLTINGNLTADAGTTFNMELAGIGTGEYDVVNINGTATLNNPTMNLLHTGYAPPAGVAVLDSFDLITATALALNPGINLVQPTLPVGTIPGAGQFGGIYRVDYAGEPGLGGGEPGGGFTPGIPIPTGPGDPLIPFTPFSPFTPVPGVTVTGGGGRSGGTIPFFDITPLLVRLFEQIPEAGADDDQPEFLQCF